MNLTKRFFQTMFALVLTVGTLFMAAAPAAAESHTIKMGADNGMLVFEPNTLEVSPGDTVAWTINKMPPHNIVFDEANAPSADVAKALSNSKMMFTAGETFEATIPSDAAAGTYTYFCSPHRGAGMIGKLVVK